MCRSRACKLLLLPRKLFAAAGGGGRAQVKLVLLLQARSEWYIAIEAGEGYTAVCSLGVPVVVFVARWSFLVAEVRLSRPTELNGSGVD